MLYVYTYYWVFEFLSLIYIIRRFVIQKDIYCRSVRISPKESFRLLLKIMILLKYALCLEYRHVRIPQNDFLLRVS